MMPDMPINKEKSIGGQFKFTYSCIDNAYNRLQYQKASMAGVTPCQDQILWGQDRLEYEIK